MREPPDLAGEAIVGALQTGFGIRVAGLSFLPVGNDADSWAFRVQAAVGPDWFLKVRSGTGAMPGAAVPAYLHRRGAPGGLAPLPTRAGEPYLVAGRVALALYPMLDARLGALADRADRLGGELAAAPAPQVLCHADLHTWNVLVEDAGRLWIADWDEAVLAPRERDLTFVVGGGIGHGLVGPSEEASFLEGYGQVTAGQVTADPALLAYYRCAWAVQ